MCSLEMLNFVYITSFQKNDKADLNSLQHEKMQRFNMTFHNSTQKNFFSKHKNKAEF